MSENGPTLRDIHLPPDPGWWPPAPGWWILGVFALVLLVLFLRVLRSRARERRWQHSVVIEVDRIAARHAAKPDPAQLAADLSQLLRRASLLLDPRAAALQGEAWLGFLDARLGGDAFSQGVGRVLVDAPWRRAPTLDADALLVLTRSWLTRALAGPHRHV